MKEKSRNGSIAADALVATLRSWFVQPDFRGCAFLNAAAELGSADPEILRVVCRHKQDMSSVLDEFFSGRNLSLGRILSVVIDGAIVHAQMGRPVEEVLEDFKTSVKAIMA